MRYLALRRRLIARSRRALLPLVIGALVGGAAACAGLAALKLWDDARGSAKAEASVLAVTFAEQTGRSLQPVDLVAQDVAGRLEAAHLVDPASFRAFAGSEPFRKILAAEAANIPQTSLVAVATSRGVLLNASTGWPTTDTDVADRDYVAYCNGPNHAAPFVGRTVMGRVDKRLMFPLARCLDGADGRPVGIVIAGVSVSYFMDFYQTIGLPRGTSVAIRQGDGRALVRYPAMGPGTPPRMQSTTARGGFVSRRRLADYPLLVEVNFAEANAFAVWRGQVTWIVVGALFVLACLLMLGRQLVGVIRRLERARVALAQRNRALLAVKDRLEAQAHSLRQTAEALSVSEARLVRQANTLQTTLEHMNQGLILVAADRTVALCNRRAMELMGLPPELMLRHPSFAEVLDYQWRSENYAFTADDIKQFVRRGGVLDQQHSYERVRPDGAVIEICSQPLDGGGVVRTYTDITLRKRAEQRLTHLAYHDELTGLCNRHALRERLEALFALPVAAAHHPALLYLDLDRFKLVNDILGHSAGDEVLKQAGQRLQQALDPADMAARLGGDEFAALLPHNADRSSALAHAERIKAALSGTYIVDGHTVRIGLSVGVALYPKDGTTTDELLRSADSALSRAKAAGRDAVRLHENAAEQEDVGRLVLEQDLRLALEQNQFELQYQPIFDTQTNRPSACEALLRWRHPTRGLLLPDLFIPIAEETGLIRPLGRWVLETACKEAATWALPVRIAVNLSSVQLVQADLERQVTDAIAASGLPPERLDLEVTESVLLSDTAHVRGVMLALQSRGIRLVMDDFGTGHSSLEALQGFPFQQIKIDRSFVAHIFSDDRAGAILPAVLSMAAKMKLEVVAEGVATAAQIDALRAMGCRYMQGFMLGRPQTPERIRDYLWRCTTSRSGDTVAATVAGP